mmetsp:Transcript_18608/g.37662  ORF Transcript_18608/g.37662 Transcript_18608/m.37662 type:complete len:259 (+) Transcript_18608:627-1403(+)
MRLKERASNHVLGSSNPLTRTPRTRLQGSSTRLSIYPLQFRLPSPSSSTLDTSSDSALSSRPSSEASTRWCSASTDTTAAACPFPFLCSVERPKAAADGLLFSFSTPFSTDPPLPLNDTLSCVSSEEVVLGDVHHIRTPETITTNRAAPRAERNSTKYCVCNAPNTMVASARPRAALPKILWANSHTSRPRLFRSPGCGLWGRKRAFTGCRIPKPMTTHPMAAWVNKIPPPESKTWLCTSAVAHPAIARISPVTCRPT